ncbi:MAG TPA: tetratricopeptide repeat protein, partial [Magnetospirillum sp.]|nr:tetratricopeptide repeat protein [Magnetospirillum sp.]
MGDDGEAVMGMMEDRVPAMAGDDAPASELDSAERARAAGDFSTALALYDATLCIYPDHVDALAGRGAALRALGRPHEALAPLIEALSRDPDHAEARLELPQALREDNRHAEARSLYALLLRAANAPAQAWHGLAMLCLSEGRDAVAEICLRRAV